MNKPSVGFTLVELLVVFAITSIFFGAGISAYGRFNRDKNVEKHAHAIQEIVETGKVKARSNDKGGCTTLDHYVVAVTNAYAVTLDAYCATGTATYNQTYQIPQNEQVQINTNDSSTAMTFYHLRPTSDAGCIVLQDQITNVCRSISVSSSGVTEIIKNCSCN